MLTKWLTKRQNRREHDSKRRWIYTLIANIEQGAWAKYGEVSFVLNPNAEVLLGNIYITKP